MSVDISTQIKTIREAISNNDLEDALNQLGALAEEHSLHSDIKDKIIKNSQSLSQINNDKLNVTTETYSVERSKVAESILGLVSSIAASSSRIHPNGNLLDDKSTNQIKRTTNFSENIRRCLLSLCRFFIPVIFVVFVMKLDADRVLESQKMEPVKLNITGSGTIGTYLMPKLINGYLSKTYNHGQDLNLKFKSNHMPNTIQEVLTANYSPPGSPKLQITIDCSGSTSATSDVLHQICDIGMSSRYADFDEDYLEQRIIGADAVPFFVNARNPCSWITVDELREIYSGQKTKWFGVSNIKNFYKDINATSYKKTTSGTVLVVRQALTLLYSDKYKVSKHNFQTSYELIQNIGANNNPGGITFAGMDMIKEKEHLVPNCVNVLKLKDQNGYHDPSDINEVKLFHYPITRPLCIYFLNNIATVKNDSRKSELVHNLVEYFTGNEGQKIVENVGFANLIPDSIKENPVQKIQQPQIEEYNNYLKNENKLCFYIYENDIENYRKYGNKFQFGDLFCLFDWIRLHSYSKLELLLVNISNDSKTALDANYLAREMDKYKLSSNIRVKPTLNFKSVDKETYFEVWVREYHD